MNTNAITPQNPLGLEVGDRVRLTGESWANDDGLPRGSVQPVAALNPDGRPCVLSASGRTGWPVYLPHEVKGEYLIGKHYGFEYEGPKGHQALVREFHETFGHPVADTPALIDHLRAVNRFEFMYEELSEFDDAVRDADLVEIADALADIVYLARGTAIEYGIDLDPVIRAVHESNMTKLGEDGKPVPHPRVPGKIGKGPNYRPPTDEIRRILIEQGADL